MEECSPAKTSCGVWLCTPTGWAFQALSEWQAFPGNLNLLLNNRKGTIYHRHVLYICVKKGVNLEQKLLVKSCDKMKKCTWFVCLVCIWQFPSFKSWQSRKQSQGERGPIKVTQPGIEPWKPHVICSLIIQPVHVPPCLYLITSILFFTFRS